MFVAKNVVFSLVFPKKNDLEKRIRNGSLLSGVSQDGNAKKM